MIQMYEKPVVTRGTERRAWLESRRRVHSRCGTGMKIGNVDQAMEKYEKPMNGFLYKHWPYFECTGCHYTEAF